MQRHLWVEFNDLDASSELTSHLDFAEEGVDVHPGAVLWVGDDEGNRCKATVLSLNEDGRARLALDLDTFEAAEHPGSMPRAGAL